MLSKVWLFLAVGLSASVIGFSSVLTAQEGGSGLQISPTKTELTIEPGEIKTITVQVKNVTTADNTIKISLNDFVPDGDTGNPKIIVDTSERLTTSLEPFLSSFEDVELAAGETKEVSIQIDAPGDIPAGAYYGAIRFTPAPQTGESNTTALSLNASVAHLLLIEVSGEITEQIQVESVSAFSEGNQGVFFLNKPDQVGVRVKNTGTGFSQPYGRIIVNDFSGNEVYSYELNNNDPRGNILPNSSRLFTDPIENITSPGKYQIVASVSHGTSGQIIEFKADFWYIPVWLIIALVSTLLALIVASYVLYRRKFAKRRR